MKELIDIATSDIRRLLYNGKWNSVNVNYHPPFVERLWVEWFPGYRIYLHRILAAERKACLFHPHPWPSVMKVLRGEYEMGVGWGKQDPNGTDEPPPVAATIYGGQGLIYEMTDPDAWHYVRPKDGVDSVYTMMITGVPWNRSAPKAIKKLEPLTAAAAQTLKMEFRSIFGV